MSINAAGAALAYAQAAKRQMGTPGEDAAAATAGAQPVGTFGAMVEQAIDTAIETGKASEQAAAGAINGEKDLVDVVSAISAAETTLQTVVAVRDKVVSAYQEIMRMPI